MLLPSTRILLTGSDPILSSGAGSAALRLAVIDNRQANVMNARREIRGIVQPCTGEFDRPSQSTVADVTADDSLSIEGSAVARLIPEHNPQDGGRYCHELRAANLGNII